MDRLRREAKKEKQKPKTQTSMKSYILKYVKSQSWLVCIRHASFIYDISSINNTYTCWCSQRHVWYSHRSTIFRQIHSMLAFPCHAAAALCQRSDLRFLLLSPYRTMLLILRLLLGFGRPPCLAFGLLPRCHPTLVGMRQAWQGSSAAWESRMKKGERWNPALYILILTSKLANRNRLRRPRFTHNLPSPTRNRLAHGS